MQTKTNRLSGAEVPSLATLNAISGNVSRNAFHGIGSRRELRVGRYGLQYSTTGLGLRESRGTGGKLLHVVTVRIVMELGVDFDAAESCRANSSKYELNAPARQRHGGEAHSRCNALKVGDLVSIEPRCVEQNARGVSADTRANGEADALDTDSVDCRNCLVRVLGVSAESLPKVDREAVKAENVRSRAAAAAAKPHCPNCGAERPKSKATERGERVICSSCRVHVDSAKYYRSVDREDLAALEDARYAERRARGLVGPFARHIATEAAV